MVSSSRWATKVTPFRTSHVEAAMAEPQWEMPNPSGFPLSRPSPDMGRWRDSESLSVGISAFGRGTLPSVCGEQPNSALLMCHGFHRDCNYAIAQSGSRWALMTTSFGTEPRTRRVNARAWATCPLAPATVRRAPSART
jgi:hypothetical protein